MQSHRLPDPANVFLDQHAMDSRHHHSEGNKLVHHRFWAERKEVSLLVSPDASRASDDLAMSVFEARR